MILRLAFFALMALGLLGFGTVAWVSSRPPPSDTATIAASAIITVLITTHPVRAGSLLKPEDLTAKQVAQSDAGDDATLDTPDTRHALVGAMARRSLGVGDVVRSKDVMHPGDHGFLSAVLSPGTRAVSVGVDSVTGAAGLIWPGDRIDLILTQAIGNVSIPVGRRISAETVLHDVRVIAIDQQLMEGVAPEGVEGKGRTVTMEVTPIQAERVSVATRIGHLSLALLPSDRVPTAISTDPPGITWASDVSLALGADVAQDTHTVVRVFQGAETGKEFVF
ncbi:MAG: Flp pilus assembly protein CpaB [Acetobacteraceae bacterium]